MLDHNDFDGIASLENSIKIAIADRRRVLNDKNSPLLRLPTELIVAIGYLVMGERRAIDPPTIPGMHFGPRDPRWRTWIGAFVSTFSQLRRKLDILRHDPVSFHYQRLRLDDFWSKCRSLLIDVVHYRGISHRGHVVIYMSSSRFASFSAAAAIAGFVECQVFWRLQQPPVVYIGTAFRRQRVYDIAENLQTEVWISYARELGMRITKFRPDISWAEEPIGLDDAREIWKKQAEDFERVANGQ